MSLSSEQKNGPDRSPVTCGFSQSGVGSYKYLTRSQHCCKSSSKQQGRCTRGSRVTCFKCRSQVSLCSGWPARARAHADDPDPPWLVSYLTSDVVDVELLCSNVVFPPVLGAESQDKKMILSLLGLCTLLLRFCC